MRIVRGRAEARWMPSRYAFAFFRLFAYLRYRGAKEERAEVLLAIEPYQSNFEVMSVLAWWLATTTCYVAELWLGSWPLAVAIPAGVLIAALLLQTGVVTLGLVAPPLWRTLTRRQTAPSRVNSFVLFLSVGLASGYAATQPSWIRFVAWQFAAVVALNAIAAVILLPLRESIARLEADGGAVSAR